MNYNWYTNTHENVRKGDIVIREDGLILMLNWNIQQYINAKTTQAIECNHSLSITRHIPAVADKRGMMTVPAHDETIVAPIPCVMSEYAGRPDFMVSQNAPGINSDMLTVCDVQYNAQTMNIMEMDEMVYAGFTYRIIHMDHSQIDFLPPDPSVSSEEFDPYGIIRLYLRKVVGEDQ